MPGFFGSQAHFFIKNKNEDELLLILEKKG